MLGCEPGDAGAGAGVEVALKPKHDERSSAATPTKRAKLEHSDMEQSGARTVRGEHNCAHAASACAEPGAEAEGGAGGAGELAGVALAINACLAGGGSAVEPAGEEGAEQASRKPGAGKAAGGAPKAAKAAATPAAEARREVRAHRPLMHAALYRARCRPLAHPRPARAAMRARRSPRARAAKATGKGGGAQG